MLNQTQVQNQSSYQTYQTDQVNNTFQKSERKESNSNIPLNSKYSSNKPYQEQRNSSNRERSRSRDLSPRQSFHDYQQGNQNQNNYNNINIRNNKSFHYRQSNDRQFNLNMNKRDSYSGGYNNTSNLTKDDCLLIFQNNYFVFNSKDFSLLKNELKRELKDDIYNIYYNNFIPGISDKVFRFTTNPSANYPCKSKALKIICDFIFDIMKLQNDKVTYLKLIFVIPDNVIGFIIGIHGQNINQIRDDTNTKIDVYSPNNLKNYRKVEVSGAPQSIAECGERIYQISRKYFNFNNEKILNRNEHSPQREKSWGRERDQEQRYGMDNFKERDRDRNDRYHDDHWNRDYDNNKDYRNMYSRERNDFRDIEYKNDYKNKESFRNYGDRDMKKNPRDFWDKNNNYSKDPKKINSAEENYF